MTGKELKRLRKMLKLTQDELGRAVAESPECYSRRAVMAWENGERKVPPAVAKVVSMLLLETV